MDAGCGTGSITASMMRYVGNGGNVIGVDINAKALEIARGRYSMPGLQFVEGDLYAMSFPENTFDFVFSHGVLIHCQTPLAILKELYRVLKPGGTIGISAVDHDSILIYPDPNGWLKKSIELQENLWKTGSGWGSTEHEGSNLRLGKSLCRLLVEAGFTHVSGYARCEYYGENQAIAASAESEISTLTATPFVDRVTALGLSSKEELAKMVEAWRQFSVTDGAFRVKTICEASAKKQND